MNSLGHILNHYYLASSVTLKSNGRLYSFNVDSLMLEQEQYLPTYAAYRKMRFGCVIRLRKPTPNVSKVTSDLIWQNVD